MHRYSCIVFVLGNLTLLFNENLASELGPTYCCNPGHVPYALKVESQQGI